jgi:hypothetical protein
MAGFKIGDALDVSFDVESREYNGKWYTDVKAWKVNAARQKEGGARSNSTMTAPQPLDELPQSDDLPF